MSKTSRIVIWVLAAVVLLFVLYMILSTTLNTSREIDYSEIESYMEAEGTDNIPAAEQITRIYVDGTTIRCYNAAGRMIYTANYISATDLSARLAEWQTKYQLTYDYADPNAGSYLNYVVPLVGIVLVCVVFWLLIRQTQGGGSKAMSFAASSNCFRKVSEVRTSANNSAATLLLNVASLHHIVPALICNINVASQKPARVNIHARLLN